MPHYVDCPECLEEYQVDGPRVQQSSRRSSCGSHPIHSGAARAARPSARTHWLPDWSVRIRKVVRRECLRTSANRTYVMQRNLIPGSCGSHAVHSGDAQASRQNAMPDRSLTPEASRPSANMSFVQQNLRRRSSDSHPILSGDAQASRQNELTSWLAGNPDGQQNSSGLPSSDQNAGKAGKRGCPANARDQERLGVLLPSGHEIVKCIARHKQIQEPANDILLKTVYEDLQTAHK